MRVLITGGAGFIGGHLANRLLADGAHVDLLDNFSRAVADPFLEQIKANPNAGLVEADLMDPAAVDALSDQYTHVVHFAAIVGVSNVMSQPLRVLRDNVALTFAAMDLARRQKNLQRFVFASTSEVVAGTLESFGIPVPTPETTPLTITDPSTPRSTYLLSKLFGEALCHHDDLPFTAIRPHNIYGPRMGMRHVIPEQLKKVYDMSDGDTLEVFSVDHRRCFCYIDDAVEKTLRLMTSPDGKGVFNLGNQSPEVTIREVAEQVIATVGRKVEIVPGPTHPGSPQRRGPETSKTDAVTQYESKYSLADGIAKTYDWYRTHVFEGAGATAI